MKRLISLWVSVSILAAAALVWAAPQTTHAAPHVSTATHNVSLSSPSGGPSGQQKQTHGRVIHQTNLKPTVQRQKAFFPTQQALKARSAATNASCSSPCDLLWHGGFIDEYPSAAAIFWGSSWSAGANPWNVTPDGQVAVNYLSSTAPSAYFDILSQYYDAYNWVNVQGYPFTAPTNVYVNTAAPPTDTSCGANTIEDSDIQAMVTTLISGTFSPPGSDYYVYTPSGYVINAGTPTDPICSSGNFCGYHSGLSTPFPVYAAIPYPNLSQCPDVGGRSPNGNAEGDSLANITSFLQFEGITDPDSSTGWYDATGLEIGGKCAGQDPGNTTLGSFTFALQSEYSNDSHSCVNALAAPHLVVNPTQITLLEGVGTAPPPQPLMLNNTGGETLSWAQANPTPHCLRTSASSGDIPAGGSQTVTLTFPCPSAGPSHFSYSIVIFANTDNGPISVPILVFFTQISNHWYFAEGFTGGSFSEYLTLENPNSVTANVKVEYLLNGASPITVGYTVSPSSRATINVNSAVGAGKSVSMVVTSDVGIVAERPMYFTYTGLSGYSIPGGTDIVGATSLGTTYDFGYVDTTTGHDTYLTVLNQNSSAMTVNVTYDAPDGTRYSYSHSVPANARGTIRVRTESGLPANTYSALVKLSEPGLVERPMYLVDGTTGYTGATDMIGTNGGTAYAVFAEGNTGDTSSTFSERYVLANPTGSAVTGTLNFYAPNGAFLGSAPISLGAYQQQIVDASSIVGKGTGPNSATLYMNSGPGGFEKVLVERFESFLYNGTIQGATDVMGANPGYLFDFAEGTTITRFSEFLSIVDAQQSCCTNSVTVTFYPSTGGSPVVKTYSLAPGQRLTIDTSTIMPNQSFSMSVSTTAPVMAERAMYFDYKGSIPGGTDVVGYQLPGSTCGLTFC
jgi:hypothetical protein